MRIDKFLKMSRVIKRRSVANEVIDMGRVSINGKVVKPSFDVKVGDVVEFFGPNMETFSYTIHKIENDLGESISVANHPNMIVYLPMDHFLEKFDMMRVKLFDKESDL